MDVLFLVCGVIIGVVATVIVSRMRRAGTLVIWVSTADEPPYMSIDLDHHPTQIAKKKYVTVKVDVRTLNTR